MQAIEYQSYELQPIFSRMGFTPIVKVLSWEVIGSMVEQGLGIGMLPDYVAKRYQLQSLKIEFPVAKYNLVAIFSKRKELSRNAAMFVEIMRN